MPTNRQCTSILSPDASSGVMLITCRPPMVHAAAAMISLSYPRHMVNAMGDPPPP